MAKRGRLIVMMAVSMAILLAFGLPVTAYGSQNSGQNNPGGYVKYTLYLINNTLINGNFVNTSNDMNPYGIAYDPSNGYLYVADSGSYTVSVINGATVIANITVGSKPAGVAYDPSNGYLYVANYGSGTVSIISTPAQAIKTYTVTFTESSLPAGTQWSVTFNGLTKSSTANSITFTGVPAGNYAWNASSIIAVGSGTRYVAQTSSGTISVPTTSSISLHYVKQHRVTIQSTAGGSTSPSGTFWYNAGSTINITAIPAPGYEFVRWETNSSITFTNSSSATTNAIINSAGTIVASFKAVPSSTQSGTVSVNTTSVSTNSTSISSVTTPTTSTSTKPTPSLVPTLVVVAVVVVVVLIVALLIKHRKP